MRRPDFDIADVLFGIFILLVVAIMFCGCVEQPARDCDGGVCSVGEHKPKQSVPYNDYYALYRQIDRDLNVVCYFGSDGRLDCIYLPFRIPENIK